MKKYLWIYLLLAGCATQKAPEGGPVDEAAPKPKSFSPENESVNYSSGEIVIEFDEYFQLTNPRQSVLISPPIEPIPEFKVRGRELIIEPKSQLKQNTTYSFFFANAIKDNNAGNDTSLLYVFSTGPTIDSSFIKARAVDAFTGKPIQNIWIVAYFPGDSLVEHKRPDYIAKTDAYGNARLSYIPNGEYAVFGLEDANFDLKYSPGERIAFSNSVIGSGNDSATVLLKMFQARDTSVRLVSSKYQHPGLFEFHFNQNVTSDSLNLDSKYIVPPAINDTIRVYIPETGFEKGAGKIAYRLTNKPDTARYYVPDLPETRYVVVTDKISKNIRSEDPIRIRMPRPVKTTETENITLFLDSLEVSTTAEPDSLDPNVVLLRADFKPGKIYTLVMKRGALSSAFNYVSDSSRIQITTYAADYLGAIKVKLTHDAPGILELVSGNTLIARTSETDATFKNLVPGKYQLRFIEDADGDGQWTPGDYYKKTQPERVFHYPETIDLRAGWDVDQSWIIK